MVLLCNNIYLLTGKSPFDGDDDNEIIERVKIGQ